MQPNDPNQFADPNQTPVPQPEPPIPSQQPVTPPAPDPFAQPLQNPISQPVPEVPDLNAQNITPGQVPVQPNTPVAPTPNPTPAQPQQVPTPESPLPITTNALNTPPTPLSGPSPEPLQPQATEPQTPRKSFPVKKLLLVFGIILVVVLIAVLAIFVIKKLGSGAPKYSETKSVELVGFSTDENSGMSFEIPKEMEETLKTDLSATYVHKEKSKNDNEGELGNVNAAIETVSYTADITESQKQEIATKFKSESFDDEIEGSIGSETKNIKVSNKTVSDDNSTLRAEVSLEIPSVEDSKEFVPAKGVIIYKIVGKRMYFFIYAFTVEVFDANEGFIKKMEEGVKFGV